MMTLRLVLAIVCGRIQIVDFNAKEPIVFEGDATIENVMGKLTHETLRKRVKGMWANQNDGTIIISICD